MPFHRAARPPSIVLARRIAFVLVKLGKLPATRSTLRWLRTTDPGRRLIRWLVPYRRPFASLDEARAAAASHPGNVHTHPANHREHFDFRVRPSDYAVILHLSRITGPITLFDLGGSFGNLFYNYARYLPEQAISNWRVFDLPETIRVGARLAARRRVADRLAFTDSLTGMDGVDVLLASGSLHYFDEPLDRMLAAQPNKPRHVLINRTPLTDGPATHTVQDAGFGLVACTLHNKPALVGGMRALGYDLVDEWQVYETSLDIPLFPDLSVSAYSGLYFRLPDRALHDETRAGAAERAATERPEAGPQEGWNKPRSAGFTD